jgi:hypothetical protein
MLSLALRAEYEIIEEMDTKGQRHIWTYNIGLLRKEGLEKLRNEERL